MRPIALSLCLWLLIAVACHAQEVVFEDSTMYRCSVGALWGVSLPLRHAGLIPGDPIPVSDNEISGALSLTSTFRLTDAVAVELTADVMITEEHRMPDEGRVAAAFPGYSITGYSAGAWSMGMAAAGISYRWSFGERLSMEPTLLAGYAGVGPVTSSISLKRTGNNEYRTITHRMDHGGGLVLISALTLRYAVRDLPSRWGLQLRVAHGTSAFDLDHTITETLLPETVRTERFTTHHIFQAINISAGAYVYLF